MKLTEITETGYFSKNSFLVGGSIKIILEIDKILSENEKNEILKIIDYLDHTLITDNKEIIKFSSRFFLLDKVTTIFQDIHTILYYFLKEPYLCTVSLGKESFTKRLKSYSNLLKFNKEG